MTMRCSRCAALLVVLLALPSEADAGQRIVIAPVATAGRDPADAKLLAVTEAALIEAVRKISGVEIANLEGNKLRGPTRADAKADPRPQVRAQALARELGADLGIAVEPQPLGEGAVVYLQIVEADGKVRGSTTVALSAEALQKGGAELERPLRGGITQVLDPPRFVGKLVLHVDVKDAQTQIDGRPAALAAAAGEAISLSVGPHAVRVTHPAYRDFLRFVDIGFDRTSTESVALAAFPLTEGEMAERRRRTGTPVAVRVPWYRSWWALGATGVVLAGVTAGIVFAVRPGITADQEARYRALPAP